MEGGADGAPVHEVSDIGEAPVSDQAPGDEPEVEPDPASAFSLGKAETTERCGHPYRHFPVAVSADAMALVWANKEDAPGGAAVVVDHEIGARLLHGRVWETPAPDSLAAAVVLRPALSVEEADVSWLVAGLAAAKASEAVTGTEVNTWWPDTVVPAGSTATDRLAAVRAEIQLGPGRVKSVVVAVRFDLVRLGVGRDGREEVLDKFLAAIDEVSSNLAEGAAGVASAYEKRCAVVGRRVRISLLPKGETRGTARAVTRGARLEVESPSSMVEKIGVDQVRDLTVLDGG